MAEVRFSPWDGRVPPSGDSIRSRIRELGLAGYTWSNRAHTEYAPHAHDYAKVLFVLEGSITWILPETRQELTTNAGDRLDLPRGTVHAARVGSNGVTCFEAHVGTERVD